MDGTQDDSAEGRFIEIYGEDGGIVGTHFEIELDDVQHIIDVLRDLKGRAMRAAS